MSSTEADGDVDARQQHGAIDARALDRRHVDPRRLDPGARLGDHRRALLVARSYRQLGRRHEREAAEVDWTLLNFALHVADRVVAAEIGGEQVAGSDRRGQRIEQAERDAGVDRLDGRRGPRR